MNYLAIDVGGTFIKYAVITDDCIIVEKNKIPTPQEKFDEFIESLVGIYQEVSKSCTLEGVALSMPGIIDSKKGFMYTGGSLRYINNVNIVEILQNKTGLPVTVENDAKCAAVAELWKGALKDCENAIVIVCGTAVGGAVIRNREVVSGKNFMAGEFSYVMTDSVGEYKMSNCLAETAGASALLKSVSEETGIPVEKLSGEKAFSLANQGDEHALEGIRKHAKKLAVQIHNYQYIFDPEKIAIGGGISEQPLLLQLIKEELTKINGIFPWTLPIPEVTTCKFFNDANLIGAVYVHIKSREKTISMDKVNELMELLENRREGEYLKALLME